jgi:hypothetical protein
MKTSPDRIELMQTFVRIVESGSMSAAAAQLGTTQPTISARLQALERSLGLQLLQRSTHAMTLTEDGTRCLPAPKNCWAAGMPLSQTCAAATRCRWAPCAW